MQSGTVVPHRSIRDPRIIISVMKGSLSDLEDFLDLTGDEIFVGVERIQISEGLVTAMRYQGHSAKTFKLLAHYGVLVSPGYHLTDEQLQEIITIERRRLENEYHKQVEIDVF